MNTTIIAVRHGETEWNKTGKHQGHLNSNLTELGVHQAQAIAIGVSKFSIDEFYCSDLGRAVQTAEIATGKRVIIDTRLDVFDIGEADGLKKEEVKFLGAIPDSSVYKGVEEIQNYIKRIFNFMNEIEDKFKKYKI